MKKIGLLIALVCISMFMSAKPVSVEMTDIVSPVDLSLTLTALEDNTVIGLDMMGEPNINTLQYSYDGVNWNYITDNITFNTLDAGQYIKFRSWNQVSSGADENYINFSDQSGSYKVSGNINTLINYNDVDNVILEDYAFSNLFNGCTRLTDASELLLPSSYLAEGCYWYMFSGCTSLTQAPALPATGLAKWCYSHMFDECESLAEAPALPSGVAVGCYDAMFAGCTSLTEAPELPATILASSCYNAMFSGCSSITEAPELPATTLAENCYWYMFEGCSSLNSVTTYATTWNSDYSLNWLSNVSETGNFYNLGGADIPRGASGIPEGWTVHIPNYFTITALEDNTIVGLNIISSPDISTLQYTYDNITWNNVTETMMFNTLQNGQYIKFRSANQVSRYDNYIKFSDASGSYKVSGNINTLIDYKNFGDVEFDSYAFYSLFDNCERLANASELLLPSTTLASNCYARMFQLCKSLTQAPALPATTVEYYCYESMFVGCTSLAQAPELPATTLNGGHCYDNMFAGCRSLTIAPELPATMLVGGCYESMFSSCSSLIEAPVLPATTLKTDCYRNMFRGCTSLTIAPELPATTLAYSCYLNMFFGCTSLTTAPELPATTLASSCYSEMFFDCTSLTEAPELPATTLASSCYSEMFFDCTSLTEAPELPATTLAYSCYLNMFSGCTSLTTAPELPATTLAENCYRYMFNGCSSLNSVTTYATTWNSDYSLNWLSNVSATGDFYNLGGADIPRGTSGIPEGWNEHSTAIDYFTITATADNTIVGLDTIGSPDISTLQYTYDGNNWYDITDDITFNTLQNGQYIKFRSENQTNTASVGQYDYIHNYIQFKDVDGSYKVSGNINTLIDYMDVDNAELGIFAFYKLFQGCTRLTDASELSLPSTTLEIYCYQSMFNGCTSLASAPALPATEMTTGCYMEMFKGCSSLTEAPELPSTDLTTDCYVGMFRDCSSLTEAPELPATTLAVDCYEEMFRGCSSLTETPELPATTLSVGCYKEMFRGCTGLTSAPALPVTTLYNGCYSYMFADCSSLTEAPVLPATILTYNCYSRMFYGCTSLSEAPELPSITLADNCYAAMFYGCTSLTEAPELPATTLRDGCYSAMFFGCTSLTDAPALPATTVTESCYSNMFAYCTSLTAAPALPATTLDSYCYTNMFQYCKSLTSAPDLPATTMAYYCYFSMFEGCESLTTAPAMTVMTAADWCCCQIFGQCTALSDASEVSLPATTMADYCYYNMFDNCRLLTSAPALPATTLADHCYYQMFFGCELLSEAPALPAITMAESCYESMFNGCGSLTTAPALPATTLAGHCYHSMFYNCTNLNSTISLPATTLVNSCYHNMFYCCWSLHTVITHATSWNTEDSDYWLFAAPSTGDFYNLGGADIPRGASGIPEGWTEHTTASITITASANNSDYGTVSGAGFYVEGETCTLTATPYNGYTFVNWTENNVEVSTDATYSFTVSEDRSLVANFEVSNHWNPDPSLYADNMSVVAEIYVDDVLQTSSDIEIGAFCGSEVRGSRRVEYRGAPFDKYVAFLTIYGEANDNITFKIYNHQNNEELVCRISQSITFTPNGTIGDLINPYVVECFTTANITAVANLSVGGTVSGAGVHSVGETVTLTATADEYYRFVNWTENDDEVSTSETYSFTAFDDRSLVANFEINNHWVPDPSLYADNMSIVGEIQIDGVMQTSSDIEIGAFCGSEVRGSQMIEYKPSPIDKYLVFLTVYGESNDNITFKLYNHQTESEYELTAPAAITFAPNATVGSLDNPHIFNFCHTQSCELTAGWNWYSTYIDIEGEDGFNMLTTGLGEDGIQVKSQSQFALYYSGYNIWTGSLNEADNTKLYMIQMSAAHTLQMSGAITDVSSTPITINKGWTWIGYPVTESMSLNDATANITPSNGDYFKSQSGFSIYYEGYGWAGSLNTLEPGRGYMYKNTGTSAMSLVYPTPNAKGALEENVTVDGNHWIPNVYEYADNMSIIAVVNIDGVEQMSENLEIGAFSNGECRGSAKPIYIEATGRYMLFMTIYGEVGDVLDFRLFDAESNEEYQLAAEIDFETNGTIGNLMNPYVFDLSTLGIGEEQPFAFSFYPNPVNSGCQLAIEGEYDKIEIINSLGVVIGEYTNTNKIEITMIPGIYYIRAINDKSIIINKLVVKQ